MKMMRFIFALPIIDTNLLPKNEQVWCLCEQACSPAWKISNTETAASLACGHAVGHFCIREWLSQFKKQQTRCSNTRCGVDFPCPANRHLSSGHFIVGGRIRPKSAPTVYECDECKDTDDGNEDEKNEKSKEDSVATEDKTNELADDAHALYIEDQDPVLQLRALNPSPRADDE